MLQLTLIAQALLVTCAVVLTSSHAFAGSRAKSEYQLSAFGWADIQALRILVRMP
jgi:hypothetical protein